MVGGFTSDVNLMSMPQKRIRVLDSLPEYPAWVEVAKTYAKCHRLLGMELEALGLSVAKHEVLLAIAREEGLSQQQLSRRRRRQWERGRGTAVNLPILADPIRPDPPPPTATTTGEAASCPRFSPRQWCGPPSGTGSLCRRKWQRHRTTTTRTS